MPLVAWAADRGRVAIHLEVDGVEQVGARGGVRRSVREPAVNERDHALGVSHGRLGERPGPARLLGGVLSLDQLPGVVETLPVTA